MRTVFCRLIGLPAIGDELRICYSHNVRGGRTEASCRVNHANFWRHLDKDEQIGDREVWKQTVDPNCEPVVWVKMAPDESMASIAASLASSIGMQWAGDLFGCQSRGAEVVITCSADDIFFYPMLNGSESDGRGALVVE